MSMDNLPRPKPEDLATPRPWFKPPAFQPAQKDTAGHSPTAQKPSPETQAFRLNSQNTK